MNELLTIITAALPISEVRGAIPVALTVFHFSPLKAYLFSFLGSILPIAPVLLVLNYASEFLMHHFYFFNKFFNWLFQYTREKHQARFARYGHGHPGTEEHQGRGWWGPLVLFVYVAITIPPTGVWSACLIAFVFGIPLRRATAAITAGAAVAALVTLLVSLGVIRGVKNL